MKKYIFFLVSLCCALLPAMADQPELLELKEMGTAAAILGKSLYTGALDLARCVQLVQE